MKPDHSLGDGVYYAKEDYAGYIRRIAALAIDTIVLFVMGILMWIVLAVIFWNGRNQLDLSRVFYLVWLAAIWFYLTVLKRSNMGTIAYLVLGLKIVNIKGERPSLGCMTFRMLMWFFGPLNPFYDVLWLGTIAVRQTPRDCFTGTSVLRKSAQSRGRGPIHLAWFFGNGYVLACPRVGRSPEPEVSRSVRPPQM